MKIKGMIDKAEPPAGKSQRAYSASILSGNSDRGNIILMKPKVIKVIKVVCVIVFLWALIVIIIPTVLIQTGIVKNADHEAQRIFAVFIEAVETKDTDKIKSLFSAAALGNGANDDIDEQIAAMFDFFDERIFPLQKDDIKRNSSGNEESSYRDGKKVYWVSSPELHIFTKNGHYYEIIMDYCMVNEADKSNEGIRKIRVYDMTGFSYYPLGSKEEWEMYRQAKEDEERICFVGRDRIKTLS